MPPKADVVIGPTDSSRAAAAIDVLANAKVALVSPANSAAALSSYKSGGYYFRTAAADVAQASVLVKLAKDGGAKSLAVVHEDRRLRHGRCRRGGRCGETVRPGSRGGSPSSNPVRRSRVLPPCQGRHS